MDLADSALHSRLRWEAFPPFAHRLEKNALSLKSLRHIGHLLPSQPDEHQCPRQELNLVLDLRRVVCESGTPQGRFTSVPRRGVEPRLAVSNTAVLVRHTRKASPSSTIPTWIRTRARTFGGSDAIRYTIGIQSFKEPTTGFAPASTCLQDRRLSQSSHVGKHEREESNPVRQLWRLTALPGAHSCKAHGNKPRGRLNHYFSSGTFQYVSLINFDQLSIRNS